MNVDDVRRSIVHRLPPPVARAARAAVHAVRSRRSSSDDGDFVYDASYFDGDGKQTPGGSGYGDYNRRTSHADIAAYLLWRFLPFDRSLDVGCAKGFVVEALCELGYDAHGCDISRYAIEGAPPLVRPRLQVVDLESPASRAQLAGDRFSLVTLFEVLEHLRPENVPDVLRFVRTISDGFVVATIPSIGRNPYGPDGFPNSKVRDERLAWYLEQGDDYLGPVPFDDLMRDRDGNPIEGHLTIASFAWWTRQFEAAGFERVGAVEQAMHPIIGRFDLSMAWNLYVFHVDDRPAPPPLERTPVELASVERRWQLDEFDHVGQSVDYVRATMGDDAVAAIEAERVSAQERQRAFESLL